MRRLLTAFSLLTVCSNAHAEGPESVSARLEWRRDRGAKRCIDGAGLTKAVNTRWGRDVFVSTDHADLVLRGTVARAAKGFVANLELAREGGASLGSRELRTASRDCRSLDDSLALAVGLMLDVSRERLAEERRKAAADAKPSAEVAPAAASIFSGPSIIIPERSRRSQGFEFEAWTGVEVSLGLLPSKSAAGRAGLALSPTRFARVELAASVSVPSEESAGTERGVDLSYLSVDAGFCAKEAETRGLLLHGCVTERIGRVRAAGFGLDRPETSSELLFDLGLREVALVRLASPFWLRLAVGLEVPLVRYRFVFDDAASERRIAYEMSRLSGGGELGLVLRWP